MTIVYLDQVTEVAVALNNDATSTSYYFKFTDQFTQEVLTEVIENTSVNDRYAYFSIDAEEIGFTTTGYYVCEIYNWESDVIGTKVKDIYVNVI